MQYKKYAVGPYNLHIIKTNKFKKIRVQVYFKRVVNKDEITKRVILSNILFESNANYKTKRELTIAGEDLYSIQGSGYTTLSGNYSLMIFNISFLNEKYTEPGMNEKSILYLMNLLFNPNIINKGFDSNSLKLVKNNIEQVIKSTKESSTYLSRQRLLEEMGSKMPYSFHNDGYLEDLDSINESNLYEYYQDVLKSDVVDIFICGDVDLIDIKKIISNHFKIKTIKKPGLSHIIEHKKTRMRNRIVKEKKSINQSQLLIGYKLVGLTDFERSYVLPIYSHILGGSADSKLFKSVREKNSLCYTIHSSIMQVSNIMIINAGIDKSNYRKALSLIKKEVTQMRSGNIEQADLDNAILAYISSAKEMLDSPKGIINNHVTQEYLNTDSLEVRMKKVKTVTIDMVSKLSNKIFSDTVYLLEGINDEQE